MEFSSSVSNVKECSSVSGEMSSEDSDGSSPIEKGVESRRRIPAVIQAGSAASYLANSHDAIAALAGLDPQQFTIEKAISERPDNAIILVMHGIETYLPLRGMVDLDEERQRLEEQLTEAESQKTRIEKLLDGPFSERAPEDVIEKERAKLTSFEETADKLREQLELLD